MERVILILPDYPLAFWLCAITVVTFVGISKAGFGVGVVLGTPVSDWHAIDLENAPTRLRINGESAGEGRVGDAMGHPFEAVAWLANLLNQQAKLLKRDMIVMTGSSITTKFPNAGDSLRFHIEGMGDVRLDLTG